MLLEHRVARVTLGVVSVLTGVAVLATILQSTPSYLQPLNKRCLAPVLAPEDSHISLPGLDRLICILVPFFVDCSRTDYGRLTVQLLMSFVGPITLLQLVEASRVGNRWSMLACMPFAAIFSWSTGIGIYLPLFFVPLMIKARSRVESSVSGSAVPLARVYAILTACALNLVALASFFAPGPDSVGEGNSWLPQSTVATVVLQLSLWSIYTILTWVLEATAVPTPKTERAQADQELRARHLLRDSFLVLVGMTTYTHVMTLKGFWQGTTPVGHLAKAFDHAFRLEHDYYAPAYFLFWDFIGAVCGSFFWILSDAETLREPALFLAVSPILSPGSALMLYAARREQRMMDAILANNKQKLQ
ncbi:hypothetical protein KVV02_007071 [Mortierella alpina]|uniref:Uncharacterized protein n=1 Tax=Mortierella alpina TaxID=64518 RepID=A0A9P8D2I9_MORAP|nr:hypothetical protein KVV02_007071 [Mortierella alpina]